MNENATASNLPLHDGLYFKYARQAIDNVAWRFLFFSKKGGNNYEKNNLNHHQSKEFARG